MEHKTNTPALTHHPNQPKTKTKKQPSYSSFLLLYPLGVGSELTMAWLALPLIKATGLWSIALPNALNFAFSYHAACVLTMLTYIPGESVEYFVC